MSVPPLVLGFAAPFGALGTCAPVPCVGWVCGVQLLSCVGWWGCFARGLMIWYNMGVMGREGGFGLRVFWKIFGAVITVAVLAGLYVALQQGVFDDHGEIEEASFAE